MDLDWRDLRIQTTSNESGAQVRITHLPTGTVGESEWERSPLRAREKALEALRQALATD